MEMGIIRATGRTVMRLSAALLCFAIPTLAAAQTPAAVRARVQQERTPLLNTMRDLVAIESGSTDLEGLTNMATAIAARLRTLGGQVEVVDPPADHIRFDGTPPTVGRTVMARFTGTGTSRILLLAHMDTVYPRGSLARQPFRVEGDRAYGLGIADDKNGVALILHTLTVLRDLGVRNYGVITVLINADEEISSPGSRALITRQGAEHDFVLSCEGDSEGRLILATSGTGALQLRVVGKASHAGEAPDAGRNALYELAHQILQMRDLSEPATGRKLNWTMANSGTARNVIPAEARATADVRVLRVADYDRLEQTVRERVKNTLIPDTTVSVNLERMRPPLESSENALRLATQAKRIYAEVGQTLELHEKPIGGGTDAAFAALQTRATVVDGFGLLGFGMHSNDAEYVLISSIEPRLYLLARMIMGIGDGSVATGAR